MSQRTAGGQTVYPDFVKELLAAEDKRRESLESRGMAVITVSGTLVTLLLGLAALVTSRQGFVLQGSARAFLVAAVVAFVVAAVFAISTYIPQPARITDPADLAKTLPGLWNKGEDFAQQKTTATRIEPTARTDTTPTRGFTTTSCATWWAATISKV